MRHALPLVLLLSLACKDDRNSAPTASATPPSAPSRPTSPPAQPPTPSDDSEKQPPAQNSTAMTGEIKLVPGESIGPIKIGMTRQQVDDLGILEPHPQYSAMTIPITVYYDGDTVSGAEISLRHAAADIDVGSVRIARTATMESAAASLKECKEPDVRKGGTLVPCFDGKLSVNVGSGDPDEVWLRIWRPGDWN